MKPLVDVIFSQGAAKALFDPVQRVYVFYGEEDRQKDEALNLLRAAAVDAAFADFDYEVLEADTAAPEQILAAAGLAPFGSPYRLVVVRGAEVYRRREKQADAERLAQGISSLGPSSCLALRVAAAEDEKSRGKTILTAKLDAAIRARGATVQCKPLTEHDLLDWLAAQARAAGKRLGEEAGLRLIQSAHGDRTALVNELEKALCYVGDGPAITLEAVEATCSYDPEDVMFKLVDAITRRDADRALRLLRELLRYDTKPQSVAGRLLALLARQYRLLWQAHELSRRRFDPGQVKNLPPDLAAELPAEGSIVGMAWKARELFATARGWDRPALAQTFELLLKCDLANKGGGEGSEDVVTNLEILILNLCRMK